MLKQIAVASRPAWGFEGEELAGELGTLPPFGLGSKRYPEGYPSSPDRRGLAGDSASTFSSPERMESKPIQATADALRRSDFPALHHDLMSFKGPARHLSAEIFNQPDGVKLPVIPCEPGQEHAVIKAQTLLYVSQNSQPGQPPIVRPEKSIDGTLVSAAHRFYCGNMGKLPQEAGYPWYFMQRFFDGLRRNQIYRACVSGEVFPKEFSHEDLSRPPHYTYEFPVGIIEGVSADPAVAPVFVTDGPVVVKAIFSFGQRQSSTTVQGSADDLRPNIIELFHVHNLTASNFHELDTNSVHFLAEVFGGTSADKLNNGTYFGCPDGVTMSAFLALAAVFYNRVNRISTMRALYSGVSMEDARQDIFDMFCGRSCVFPDSIAGDDYIAAALELAWHFRKYELGNPRSNPAVLQESPPRPGGAVRAPGSAQSLGGGVPGVDAEIPSGDEAATTGRWGSRVHPAGGDRVQRTLFSEPLEGVVAATDVYLTVFPDEDIAAVQIISYDDDVELAELSIRIKTLFAIESAGSLDQDFRRIWRSAVRLVNSMAFRCLGITEQDPRFSLSAVVKSDIIDRLKKIITEGKLQVYDPSSPQVLEIQALRQLVGLMNESRGRLPKKPRLYQLPIVVNALKGFTGEEHAGWSWDRRKAAAVEAENRESEVSQLVREAKVQSSGL